MSELLKNMQVTFDQAQSSTRNHPELMAKMKKWYRTRNHEEFSKSYISCLIVLLSHGEKDSRVENMFSFAATFAMSLYSCTADKPDEELCPFLKTMFDFLLENHDTANTAMRIRICYFLGLLLSSMGEDALIDDFLHDKIVTCMTERLMDTVPKVRAQAVLALKRLQDPTDESCPVVKAFIFHLTKDPQAEVRLAVLRSIGKNKQSLAAALRRTRDINKSVRKAAFVFLSTITVRSLTIDQREKLLKDGLHDRSEKVSNYVKTQLLPVWLEHYNGEFIKLLRGLDAERTLDLSDLVLQVLFEHTPLREITKHVPVDEDTKLIPFEKLSSESVIYWRCAIEHLHKLGFQDEIDKISPDLLKFCQYIAEFIEYMKVGKRVEWEKVTHRFILVELFKITKHYDLSDEVGRECLKELILDLLKTENNSEVLIACVIKLLVSIVPNNKTRLTLLANVISYRRMPSTTEVVLISEAEKHEREMKEARLRVALVEADVELDEAIKREDFLKANELKTKIQTLNESISELRKTCLEEEVQGKCEPKTDNETLTQCLWIVYATMQSVGTLCPLLRKLFDELVVPNLDHGVPEIVILALKTTTVCGLMDENLAKKYLPIFFLQFTMENDAVTLQSLKGIFDLSLGYGLESLGMAPGSDATKDDRSNDARSSRGIRLRRKSNDYDAPLDVPRSVVSKINENIINALTEFLDDINQDIRTITTEGLCKLLLRRRISGASLLARLIVLWHNPVTEHDAYLRQCLSNFFTKIGAFVPDSQDMLERSFLPTLKILANAPETSPLQEIDPIKVAQLILHLTAPEGGSQPPLASCPHNNLALAIIAEALNADSDIDPKVLIRSLKFLDLSLEDDSMRDCLKQAVERLSSEVQITDKRIVNAIANFKRQLEK